MIEDNQKFACLAISNLPVDLTDPELKLDGFFLLNHPPVNVDKYWKDWLGSITIDSIKEANFFILNTIASENLELLNNENQDLIKSVYAFYKSLFFIDIPEYDFVFALTGAKGSDNTVIRQTYTPQTFYCDANSDTHYYTENDFVQVVNIKKSMDFVNSKNCYKRLKRGINAYFKALSERDAPYRIHQYVRALEALIMPPTGETKKKFIHRCQTFTRANENARKILSEIYDLRSKVEHMHDWQDALIEIPAHENEKIAMRRTRQIEYLTRETYKHILLHPDILAIFRNNNSIEEFWKKHTDSDRKKIWNKEIDLPDC